MRWLLAVVVIGCLFVAQAQADPITGLFNTGVDGSGAVLPYGSTDTHYIIASSPDGSGLLEKTMDSSGGFPIGPWLGDNTTSRWDSESSDGHGGEGSGTFDNQTTFISPFAGTATITGQWSTDDTGNDILLNGASTGNTAGGFQNWFPFTITGPVTAGVNTLDFLQGQGGSPGGVRVEFFSGTVDVPEPTTMVLFGLGAVGLVVAARRRRSA